MLSLQWLVVLLPRLLVLGEVVASAQGLDPAARLAFQQRLLIMGGLVQVGPHRAARLGGTQCGMVGMLATLNSGPRQR